MEYVTLLHLCTQRNNNLVKSKCDVFFITPRYRIIHSFQLNYNCTNMQRWIHVLSSVYQIYYYSKMSQPIVFVTWGIKMAIRWFKISNILSYDRQTSHAHLVINENVKNKFILHPFECEYICWNSICTAIVLLYHNLFLQIIKLVCMFLRITVVNGQFVCAIQRS